VHAQPARTGSRLTARNTKKENYGKGATPTSAVIHTRTYIYSE